MKETYTLELTVDMDTEKLMAIHDEKWLQAAKESVDEFIADLEKFVNEHPFPVGCRLAGKKIE